MKRNKRPKNVIFKIVFSRTMITILLILVQIFIVCEMFIRLGEYSTYALVALNVAATFCLIYLVNKDDIAEFKLAWAIPICAMPVFGVVLFWFVDQNFGSRESKKQVRRREEETKEYLYICDETRKSLHAEDRREQSFFSYMEKVGNYPAYRGGKVEYFPWGKDKWEDVLSELEKAKEFIFLEYFIIEQGVMWDAVVKILKRKAAEGVEVRVMYDGMCTVFNLPYQYPTKLRRYGIKVQLFSPILPLLSTHQNNRDHRKILVIDGKIAYNGGVNFADEYIGERIRFGTWKDTAVKIEGKAVDSFTLMFLQMWNASKLGKIKEYERYIFKCDGSYDAEPGLIVPYGDGPHHKEKVAKHVYMDILYTAEKYVHIMTPYFIVDNEILGAMKYAASRGVDVKLILPHIPDKRVVFSIARNFYPTLLQYGIKVYEYTPGFIHAKVFSSDDKKAVVGSINLDYRSLYHHYECATYIYGNPVIDKIENDFQKTLKECQQVDLSYYKKIRAFDRLTGWIFKLFGPLM